eukprot:158361_1
MHASHTAISKMTPEIVLRSVFNRYDIHVTGHLELDAFSLMLEDLGISCAHEQQALFALGDSSNKRTIHFTDFLNLIKSNDFEHILSNQEDYLFVIKTYESFREYDVNRDGLISWDEFYFYLFKQGYSHEYISTYWYYMDTSGTGSITFEQFWKGFKPQSAQQTNGDTKQQQIPYNNIFAMIKKQLKPVKRTKRRSPFKLGRVCDDEPRFAIDEDIQYNQMEQYKAVCARRISVMCPLCAPEIEDSKDKSAAVHLLTDRKERRAICNDMEEHRAFCGSRSEKRDKCNQFVPIMNTDDLGYYLEGFGLIAQTKRNAKKPPRSVEYLFGISW